MKKTILSDVLANILVVFAAAGLLFIMAFVILGTTPEPAKATITQSNPVMNVISPQRTESHHIVWSTTDTSGLLKCTHKYWGAPLTVINQWTTSTPYADAETVYIIPSEYVEYDGDVYAGSKQGNISLYRDEGITGGCISGASCDIVLVWPNR